MAEGGVGEPPERQEEGSCLGLTLDQSELALLRLGSPHPLHPAQGQANTGAQGVC